MKNLSGCFRLKRQSVAGPFFLILLSLLPASAAPLLGTMSSSGNVTTFQTSPHTNLSVLIAAGASNDHCFDVGECAQVAFLEGIDASAIGTIITLNPGVSNFASAASILTNGVLDQISIGIVPGPSYGSSSGGAVTRDETAFGTNPDFSGLMLGSLQLRIDDVVVRQTTFDGGPATFFSVTYTINVFGDEAVPEPATWASALIGCLMLIACRPYTRG